MNDEVKAIVAAGYAEHVRDIVLSRDLIASEIDNLKSQLLPKGISIGDKVRTSPTADTIPDGVIKLQELIAEYTTKTVEYVDEIRDMHNALLHVEVIPRTALTKHYIHLMTWEEVCVSMRYSYRGIMAVRKRGLVELYDYIPVEYRHVLPRSI